MNITGFDQTGLSEISEWLDKNKVQDLSESDLRELLKTANIFVIAEGINRVQSTLLCELKASYVQQSQRYVSLDLGAYYLPELAYEDNDIAGRLMDKAFDLYSRMSELKEGCGGGRPKPQYYVHNIPIEDARYILPLATKTNLSISMTGDKLIDLYKLCRAEEYAEAMADFWRALSSCLPSNLLQLFSGINVVNVKKFDFFQEHFDKINEDNKVVLLAAYKDLDLKVGLGALTSTQRRTTSEILQDWGEEVQPKVCGVVQRVLGYGHESIAELARTTFGMMCSLATYHQQIRHRLPEYLREDFRVLITDLDRPVVVPESIQRSVFAQEYLELVQAFKEFRLKVYKQYGLSKALPLLLNCEQIKMIMSTNARIDLKMLAERTCMNAQWEIRDLAVKKLKILRGLSGILYEKALPSCLTGKCREGKLSCGKQEEVRELFRKI